MGASRSVRGSFRSVRGSFESAAQAITRATGAAAGKRQMEQLARRAAADVDAFYAARRPGPRPDDELLVMTFDGKGIVTRPEALRPATAKAALASIGKVAWPAALSSQLAASASTAGRDT